MPASVLLSAPIVRVGGPALRMQCWPADQQGKRSREPCSGTQFRTQSCRAAHQLYSSLYSQLERECGPALLSIAVPSSPVASFGGSESSRQPTKLGSSCRQADLSQPAASRKFFRDPPGGPSQSDLKCRVYIFTILKLYFNIFRICFQNIF